MKILVTGAAGFIGMHSSLWLLARGDHVVGVDNLNDYWWNNNVVIDEKEIKKDEKRLKNSTVSPSFFINTT